MPGFLSWVGGQTTDYELDFPQFLKRYQLQVLPVSTDDIVPGAVLDGEGGSYFRANKGFIYQGHLSELMPRVPDSFWDTEMNQANLVNTTVSHNMSLKGKNAVNWWGINVGGGLDAADSANFRITDIKARTFKNGKGHASILSLRPILSRLKLVQPESHSILVGKWVVMETYYASEVVLEFQASNGANLKADVEQAGGVKIHGEGEAQWKNASTVKVTQNVNVPFAFSGFRVPK